MAESVTKKNLDRKIFISLLIMVSSLLAHGTGLQDNWIKFSSPEGGFSVLLRDEPKFQHDTDPESKLDIYRYSDLEIGYGFVCEYFDNTEMNKDLQVELDLVVNGIIKGAKATKLSDERITYEGYPGRDVELSVPGTKDDIPLQMRVLLVGKRVYVLSYIHLKWLDPTRAVNLGKRFFSSFHLTART